MRPLALVSLVFFTTHLLACAPTWSSTVKKDERPAKKKAPPPPPTMAAPTGELGEIFELEDRRSYGDGRLALLALTDNDPKVRKRALLALGRIQADESAQPLLKGLSDPDPGARAEAAFGVGLLGLAWQPMTDATKDALVTGLKAAEASETDAAVKLAMLEALGRLATPAAVEVLTDRLSGDGDVQWRAAMSLGIAAKQGAKLPSRAVTALGPMLKPETAASLRYAAAYALMRSNLPASRTWMLLCAQDEQPDIRATCAKGLGGDVGQDADAVTLGKMLDDPDARVASEAARSLAKLAGKCKGTACAALGALKGLSSRVAKLVAGNTAEGAHPLLAMAQEGLPPAGRPLLQSLRQQLLDGVRGVRDARVKQDIANLECRLAAAMDRQTGTIAEVLKCGGGLVPEGFRLATGLREVAQSPLVGKHVSELLNYAFHAEDRVKMAAMEALGATKSPLAVEKLRLNLGSSDPLVAANAALALAKLKDKGAVPQIRALALKAMSNPDIAPAVAEALTTLEVKEAAPDLQPWLQSTHATIRYTAADALTQLTGKEVRAPHVERPKGGTRPPMPPAQVTLQVMTDRGDFEMELLTQGAPLTSLNMYTLARKGFFKGLTFHRIVPDFVAQGGDPRGDGEGGPGYSIRCEIGHAPYARGVVGMALSGKDTGGSQFFVTHAPQPHLDGRYTVFGRVTKGMEIVDALLEGDRIVDVRTVP